MFLRSIVINLFLGRELMNESAGGVCGCGAGAQYLFVTPQLSAPPPSPHSVPRPAPALSPPTTLA